MQIGNILHIVKYRLLNKSESHQSSSKQKETLTETLKKKQTLKLQFSISNIIRNFIFIQNFTFYNSHQFKLIISHFLPGNELNSIIPQKPFHFLSHKLGEWLCSRFN